MIAPWVEWQQTIEYGACVAGRGDGPGPRSPTRETLLRADEPRAQAVADACDALGIDPPCAGDGSAAMLSRLTPEDRGRVVSEMRAAS